MEPIQELVTTYAEKFSSAEPVHLAEISAATIAEHPLHHMLSGHLQGRFLAMISRLMRPGYILEIGSFTGYSGLCLAEGLLPESGQLHAIELRPAEAITTRQNFNKSPQAHQLFVHEGDARSIIPALPYTWDLVFIDADKTGYLQYYELVLPRLRKGGLIIADNVLFHGEVFEETPKGKNARAIQAFNEYVRSDESVDKVLVTMRDGLLLVQKK